MEMVTPTQQMVRGGVQLSISSAIDPGLGMRK